MAKRKTIDYIIIEQVLVGKNSWNEIMEAITNNGHKIKNWMTVRGELQRLINAECIVRIPNVYKEENAIVD